MLVPVADVHRDPTQDRKNFDPDELEVLARSIRAVGLLQPITVRPRDEGGWTIVAGERRWRAHGAVGDMAPLDMIEVIVREGADHRSAMLAENVVRADLNPIEEAEAYASRVAVLGSVEAVAREIGVRPATIRKRLGLLELRPELQHLVGTGNLLRTYADEMTALDANRQMVAMAALRKNPGMWIMDFQSVCRKLANDQAQEGLFDVSGFELVSEAWTAKAAETVAVVEKDPPFAIIRVIAMCEQLAAVCPDPELAAQAKALIAKAPRMRDAASDAAKQMARPLPAGPAVLDSLLAS